MTATYWEVGRRIVEWEQQGNERACHGLRLLQRLRADLTSRFGRGFLVDNLEAMRRFYITYPPAGRKSEKVSRKSGPVARFPLPWSHYVLLLRVKGPGARTFYEAEALHGGWRGLFI